MADDQTPVALLREKAAHYADLSAEYSRAADLLEREMPTIQGAPGSTPVVRRRAAASDPKKSTMAMIEAVLTTTSEPLDPPTLTEAMREQGWDTDSVNPTNTVRTALSRLVERRAVERVDGGRFQWHWRAMQTAETLLASNGSATVSKEASPVSP
jgi:hypothetical protein